MHSDRLLPSRTALLNRAALVVLILIGASGCGGDNPFDMIPISGKVTYEDGSPIPATRITVIFVPQVAPLDAKTYASPGQANVDVETGEFHSMTTRTPGDGAAIGRHKVQIMAMGDDLAPSPAVPLRYRDPTTSDIPEVEVGPDSTYFEIKIKRS